MPVELSEDWMAFCSQKESTCTLALLVDEPVVYAVEFSEEFKGELSNFLVFADESWFYGEQTRLCVLLVMTVKVFEFIVVLVEQWVEEDNGFIVLVDAFNYNVS